MRLTEVVRYELPELSLIGKPLRSSELLVEDHSVDDGWVADFLQHTEVGSVDLPELLPLLDWNQRLAGYGASRPDSELVVTSLSHRDQRLGIAVWTTDWNIRECDLHYLGVRPAARRQGWGQILLQQIRNRAFRREMESIQLNVDIRNRAAIALYDKQGFQEIERRKLWICRDRTPFSTGSTHRAVKDFEI